MSTASTHGNEGAAPASGIDWALVICVVLTAVILLWAGVIALQGWFHGEMAREMERKIVERPVPELEALLAEQNAALGEYTLVPSEDAADAVVRLPLERAEELLLNEAAAKGAGR